ncbi:MAG: hypothetical protein P8Y18_06345, partial [Candidatus Bathyarchaeota archaeon]
CQPHLMTISFGDSFSEDFDKKYLHICSSNCKENFINLIERKIEEIPPDLSDSRVNVLKYIELTIDENELSFDDKLMKNLVDYPFQPNKQGYYHIYEYLEKNFFDRIYKKTLLRKAEIFLEVKRFEEAAKIYEDLGMYKEAGAARTKNKQLLIRNTEITVDLNKLLNQIKDGGLIVVYRCPHCNAPLKVNNESNIESITVCSHCNTKIATIDVVDFLKAAVS